jgi:hypothetical protein
MRSFRFGIVALGLLALSASAQQINISGKAQDTSGVPLEGVIVSLAAHPTVADTTGKDGLFHLLSEQSTGIVPIKSDIVEPFTKRVGSTISFAVTEPTAVTIDIFTIRGQKVSQPLNQIVPAGVYRYQLMTKFAQQNLVVRVSRGKDVQAFKMLNMARQSSSIAGIIDNAAAVRFLAKTAADPALDTLVFTRRGLIPTRLPITSYTSTAEITASLRAITDPYIICYALNLMPADTASTPHFRDDTTYQLSLIAANIGGGNELYLYSFISSSEDRRAHV